VRITNNNFSAFSQLSEEPGFRDLTARLSQLSESDDFPKEATATDWDSVILLDFPSVFEDFRGKRFSLLWRGGRDGSGAPTITAAATGARTY
jgi:hypothetical protein